MGIRIRRRLGATAAVLLIGLVTSCRGTSPAVRAPEAPESAPAEFPRIPRADPAAARVPEGYRVEIAVRDLAYPSSIALDDRGNLYVAEAGYVYGDPSAPARVLRVGPSGRIDVLATQLSGPVTDLLWHEGRLYVSHRGKISVLTASGELHDLVTGLPSLGDHHNNQLAFGPDGWIYFGQGTATNSGVVGVDNFLFQWLPLYPGFHDRPAREIELADEEFASPNPFALSDPDAPKLVTTTAFSPFGNGSRADRKVPASSKPNGAIFRMRPDGSALEVYAWGLRNPFGVRWSPDGKNLYVTENGYDERGSRPIANAPDFLWEVKRGAWYGFPDYIGGVPVTDPRFRPEHGPAPKFLMASHPPAEKPLLERPMHSALTKLDFSTSPKFGFEGQLFVGEFGDNNPITGHHGKRVGYQVVRIDPKSREVTPFFRARPEALGPKGMEYVLTAGPKRPVDVRFSPGGDALYVVDLGALAALPTKVPTARPFEGTGVVWRITRQDAERAQGPKDVSVRPGASEVR